MSHLASHPWLSGLFEDTEVQNELSAQAQLRHMLAIEAAFARALAKTGRVPADVAEQAAKHILDAEPDMARLKQGVAEDGLVVPALVRQLKQGCPHDWHPAIHTGLTSQDVIDTALILCVKSVLPLLSARLTALDTALTHLGEKHGHNQLMARTRMQAALPITVATRLSSWQLPIADHQDRLKQMAPRLLILQLGGAAGDRAALGDAAGAIETDMAQALGLSHAGVSWHSRRDAIAEFSNWLSLVSGTLGKMGQDIALMSQQGLDDVVLAGGGRSSAMAHKRNPIRAELLVTLARANAVQLSGMHHALIHEQERSGAAWVLEWMLLPQMVLTTGRSLTASLELVEQIDRIGHPAGASDQSS